MQQKGKLEREFSLKQQQLQAKNDSLKGHIATLEQENRKVRDELINAQNQYQKFIERARELREGAREIATTAAVVEMGAKYLENDIIFQQVERQGGLSRNDCISHGGETKRGGLSSVPDGK